MTPWLSVVVPVHDGAAFLGATLAAAAAECPDGVEFLVYDSGADDGACAAIVRSFADRLALRYAAEVRPGQWTSKTNRGVREARAPHVAMLHQDDLWLPGHLAAVRAAIARCPDAVLSIGPSRFVGAAGQDVGGWSLPFAPGRHDGADLAATLIVQNTVAIPSPVIRRDAWLAAGGMDEGLWYTADWDMYLRLARQGPVYVRAETTTAFRLHGASLTMSGSRDLADFRAQQDRVVDRHADLVPPACRRRQLRLARAAIATNVALSAASRREWRPALHAAAAVLALGPVDWARLLGQTRLIDRLLPRLRLSLAGDL